MAPHERLRDRKNQMQLHMEKLRQEGDAYSVGKGVSNKCSPVWVFIQEDGALRA